MKRHLIIGITSGLLFCAALALVFFSLREISDVDKNGGRPVVVPRAAPKALPRAKRELVPARPQDYGMVVTPPSDMPGSQEEWNTLIGVKISELKKEYPPEVWVKIEEKIKEDPADTAQKLKDIDAAIKSCRDILKKDPDNDAIKNKLEHLMMLKSIGKDLPSGK